MRQAGEPSVEEILDSIKQVIARDNREIASATRKRREEDSVRADADDTDQAAEEDAEVLDLAEAGEVLAEEAIETDTDDAAESENSALVDANAEETMRESLAALAMLSEPPQKPQIVRSGETSLEDLTRELMRPMLKEWLDANLPAMVEQMVAAEIARIAGKKDR